MQTELLLNFVSQYNVKQKPDIDDFYHFLGYLNIITENDTIKMFSGLGYIKGQHKSYISWLHWFQDKDIYEQTKLFCSEKLGISITELQLETDNILENIDIDLVNKTKYTNIQKHIKSKPNHITYVSSYFQPDKMDRMYEKIHKVAKEYDIVVDIIFQSTIYEEQGDYRMELYERFVSFFDSLIYFKPSLFYIHTGWTYCKITKDMYNVFSNLKKFKPDISIITDTDILYQDSFLPPNGNMYYDYDSITYQRTKMNSLGVEVKKLNYEAYIKTKNEIFSNDNELSLTFKTILKNV